MSKQTVRPFDTRDSYTKMHNYAFDVIMPQLSGNTWKVLCFIIRKTKGWGKDAERLSYPTIKAGTGIASDTTLSKAIKELTELKYIETHADADRWQAHGYSLNTTLEIEATPRNGVDATTENGVAPTPKNGGNNKETIKETIKEILPSEVATPPAPQTSLSKKFSTLLEELKTTKNRPACLREISILCFGDNSDTPTYAYLAKAAKQVGGAGRLAEEMWKLTARPPTGDVLAYILGKCKSQKNGNGFGLTNWRKNNGEDSTGEDTGGDSSEQADFWRNHFANNPVVPALPVVQGHGLGVRR